MYSALNRGYRKTRSKRGMMTSRFRAATARQSSARAAFVAAARANTATRDLQLARGEFKSIDTYGAFGDVDWTGTVALVNGCARGDDINERIGRQITMRSIQATILIRSTGAAGTPHVGRVLLVYDRQCNAAALTAANVLATVGSAQAVVTMRNLENRNRFSILMDRRVSFSANMGGAGVGMDNTRMVQFYRKLNHPVAYNNGDAGSIADITSGSLYLVMVTDTNVAADEPEFSYQTRVRYTDQ